jgi:hypothetical protein
MLTNSLPSDSSQGGLAAVLRFAEQVTQVTMELGEVKASVKNTQEALGPLFAPQQPSQTVAALASKINGLVTAAEGLRNEIGSGGLACIDRAARDVLEKQMQVVENRVSLLKGLFPVTMRTALTQAKNDCKELLPVFERQVARYLQTRNGNDLVVARKTAEEIQLKHRSVVDLKALQDQWSSRYVRGSHEPTVLEKRINDLSRQISNGWQRDPCGRILCKLEEAMARGLTAKDLDEGNIVKKSDINKFIDKLHQELGSDRVNYWIWELASRPEEKNYGVEHRYDDLARLRMAIRHAGEELIDSTFRKNGPGLDPAVVFDKLYQIIGEPDVETPQVWMRENACYYIKDLKEAIHAIKLAEHDFTDLTEEDSSAHRWLDVSQSDFHRARLLEASGTPSTAPSRSPLAEQEDFFSVGANRLDFSGFDPHYSTLFEPIELLPTQILKRLGALIEQRAPISEEFKIEVQEMIRELGKHGQRETVDGVVYDLSQAPYKNRGEWVVKHRYDDLKILQQALQKALENDVYENIVVQLYPAEEDRSAFYAEIARLALVGPYGTISSNVDPVAYGKENIAMYLHRIEEAVLYVNQRIERRGADITRQSFADLDSIVSTTTQANLNVQALNEILTLISRTKARSSSAEVIEECKSQVREMIENPCFDELLRNEIFTGIWILNGGSRESYRGEKHYLDDFDQLQHVLESLHAEYSVTD